MNCDQAFDVLTDTNLRGSSALNEHLASCPRCRDMAELLDPALDLFGDVVASENEEIPESSVDAVHNDRSAGGTRSPQAELPLAESTKPGVSYRPWLSSSRRRIASQQDGLKVAAFLMFVAVMMAAMVNVERGSRNDAVAISLPESCQRSVKTESTSDNVVAGCVACHLKATSLVDLQPAQRVHARQLVQRCVSCHLDMTTDQFMVEAASAGHRVTGSPPSIELASCLFGRGSGSSQL